MMRKNLAYKDLTAQEAYDMEQTLRAEISHLSRHHIIYKLFEISLSEFKMGLWKYDGPTFSKAPRGFWEMAAWFHDWRNSFGYVSKAVDREMFSIMILLNYPYSAIIQIRQSSKGTGSQD